MPSKFVLFIAVLSAAVLSGCNQITDKQDGVHSSAHYVASYSSLRTQVFELKCVSCHNATHASGDVDLSDYKKIVDQSVFPPLVIPGNPEASSLYKVVKSGDMPKKRPRLSDAEVRAIYDWIKKGAPEIDDASPLPSPSTGEPGEPGQAGEPCDHTSQPGEPGVINCTNEPN